MRRIAWGLVMLAAAAAPFAAPARAAEPFKDCAHCPEMVVIPAGSFTMGAARSTDPEAKRYEGPPHTVKIARFAIGRYEVTFAEWDACVAAKGCAHRPDDRGWGRERRPVINISWTDAREYVRWLARTTGKPYRLPSEAEWEYAARAGTTTPYWWGPALSDGQADCLVCGGTWSGRKTAPVGRFKPNPFGLYDTQGNVWEWVADCWHDGYAGAPANGQAWVAGGDCKMRVLRGGSWLSLARSLRVSHREGYDPTFRYASNGLRVARDLP
jgi:formylglycine-generating enzyme required for sulfatase activity